MRNDDPMTATGHHILGAKPAFIELSKRLVEAQSGAVYAIDLLAFGAINRSISNIDSFSQLFQFKNFLCAAAILRFQIDTTARFYALSQVDDPERFAVDVIAGKRIDKLLDKNKRKMTDRHLVEALVHEAPWIVSVYEETCGFIHFSQKHTSSTITGFDAETRSINVAVGGANDIPETAWSELDRAFVATTELLLRVLCGWLNAKEGMTANDRAQEQSDASVTDP